MFHRLSFFVSPLSVRPPSPSCPVDGQPLSRDKVSQQSRKIGLVTQRYNWLSEQASQTRLQVQTGELNQESIPRVNFN